MVWLRLNRRQYAVRPAGRYDPWLLLALIGTGQLGVVMVASSSIAVADSQHIGEFYYLKRHCCSWLGGGLLAWLIAMRVELELAGESLFRLLMLATCCCWRCSCRTSACASTARGAGSTSA